MILSKISYLVSSNRIIPLVWYFIILPTFTNLVFVYIINHDDDYNFCIGDLNIGVMLYGATGIVLLKNGKLTIGKVKSLHACAITKHTTEIASTII